MSTRKHSVLATSVREAPWDSSSVRTLATACSVWAATPAARRPSAMPTWPETMSQSPARTTGVYGPKGLVMGRRYVLAADRPAALPRDRPGGSVAGVAPGGGGHGREHGVGAVHRRAVARLDDDLDRRHLVGPQHTEGPDREVERR